MNLSNILCNSIYNKLKLTVLYKEKFYVKNLFNQINQLEQVKKENDKSLSKKNINDSLKKDLTIYYILNISFLKTNTTTGNGNPSLKTLVESLNKVQKSLTLIFT